MRLSKCVLLLLCLQISKSTENSKETYRAAVVEFGVRFSSDVQQYFENNVQRYTQLIQEASSQNVDLLVFPESTLNYGFTADRHRVLEYALYLPDPQDKISPCDTDDYGTILKAVSCAARTGQLYVVVNLSEKLRCDPASQAHLSDNRQCHEDEHYLFNSNVVFDRYGRVVSRYRKIHLFGEIAFNTTAVPELETFSTDFGVEFGHMICFDLIYEVPPQAMLKNGIKNFVLPLMWYSELPFLTAVQYQEAWAYSSDANLLAAGASSPLSGSGGSGIFSGKRGAKASIMSGDVTTRMLIADLYKDPAKDPGVTGPVRTISDNPRRMNLLRDHLQYYSIRFLEPEALLEGRSERICYGEFCCTFNITASLYEQQSGPRYEYALVAFRGVRTFSGVANGGMENCGLVACTERQSASCGLRFSQSTNYSSYVVFEEITLAGDFTNEHSAQYPATLTGDMLPLATDQYKFESSTTGDRKRQITVKLTARQDDLLTFGVLGRLFDKDFDLVVVDDFSLRNVNSTILIDLEYDTNSGDEIFDYIWSKLRVLLIVFAIYVLEMM